MEKLFDESFQENNYLPKRTNNPIKMSDSSMSHSVPTRGYFSVTLGEDSDLDGNDQVVPSNIPQAQEREQVFTTENHFNTPESGNSSNAQAPLPQLEFEFRTANHFNYPESGNSSNAQAPLPQLEFEFRTANHFNTPESGNSSNAQTPLPQLEHEFRTANPFNLPESSNSINAQTPLPQLEQEISHEVKMEIQRYIKDLENQSMLINEENLRYPDNANIRRCSLPVMAIVEACMYTENLLNRLDKQFLRLYEISQNRFYCTLRSDIVLTLNTMLRTSKSVMARNARNRRSHVVIAILKMCMTMDQENNAHLTTNLNRIIEIYGNSCEYEKIFIKLAASDFFVINFLSSKIVHEVRNSVLHNVSLSENSVLTALVKVLHLGTTDQVVLTDLDVMKSPIFQTFLPSLKTLMYHDYRRIYTDFCYLEESNGYQCRLVVFMKIKNMLAIYLSLKEVAFEIMSMYAIYAINKQYIHTALTFLCLIKIPKNPYVSSLMTVVTKKFDHPYFGDVCSSLFNSYLLNNLYDIPVLKNVVKFLHSVRTKLHVRTLDEVLLQLSTVSHLLELRCPDEYAFLICMKCENNHKVMNTRFETLVYV